MRIRLHNYFEHPKGTGLWKRHSKNPSHAQTSTTSVVTDSTGPLFHKEKSDLVSLNHALVSTVTRPFPRKRVGVGYDGDKQGSRYSQSDEVSMNY